jgi:homoserine O-acetyltransferase/O-succinyltransferase
MSRTRDDGVLEISRLELQSGAVLPRARLAYRTYGALAARRDNAVVYPTRFAGGPDDNEFLIGEGMALDPRRYLIIVPSLLGNGLSSSPSTTPAPLDCARFPCVTAWDNVTLQHRLVVERLGVERIALVVGWSMGAQHAYHWAARFPDLVERLAPICGSARTSPHNRVFLEGMKAALTCDPAWEDRTPLGPQPGLRAMGRAWAGWALSHEWYRSELFREQGYGSIDDYLARYWETRFVAWNPHDLLSLIWTWQNADISANEKYRGDLVRALASIRARTMIMPGQTDLYFPQKDSEYEVRHLRDAELRPIPSIWGHFAGGGHDPDATRFIDRAIGELLAR